MKKHSLIKNIIFSIAMIGAINWGLVGFFNFEVFSYIFGAESIPCKLIYILISICALASLTFAVADCQCYCENKKDQ